MAIKTIGIDELDGFKIDTETNELFWHSQKVRMGIRLPVWVEWSALVVAAATLIQALSSIVQAADLIWKWVHP